MTCIVALKHGGRVHMGADSAGASGWSIVTRADPKIYTVGPFLFGFTTSFRMGQLLGYSLNVPPQDLDESVERFMTTVFINAVRDCLKTGGFASKTNEHEEGGLFLVAYRGRIFRVDGDYQVGESTHDFDAVGCGEQIALGSLFSTKDHANDPRGRLHTALEAAHCFSNGVRGPFLITMSDRTAP